MNIRHEKWILIPQENGDCTECAFYSKDVDNDCTAASGWRQCTKYVYDENNSIVANFYRYSKLIELHANTKTI